MNKADIVEKVHDVLGGTKADAERAVEAVRRGASEVMCELAASESIVSSKPPAARYSGKPPLRVA